MIVVDSSVVIKWIHHDEEYAKEAEILRDNHILGKETILVPQLLYYETANALVTKTTSTEGDISDGLDLIYKAQLLLFPETAAIIKETSMLAKQYKTTVYDMLYAVIAKSRNVNLITADETFIRKTHLPFVQFIYHS